MKIIQLTYALGSGGAERVVVDLANELYRQGHEVIVCAILDLSVHPIFSFNIKNLSYGVKYVNLHQKRGFSFSKMRTIEQFIKSVKPDVVHCHLNNIPYVFRLALSDKSIKFVYTLHNIASKASGSKFQIPLNRYFFKRNLIRPVTISKICDDSYRQLYKLNNSVCINNGRSQICSTNEFKNVKQQIESFKADNKTKVFIHVARFYPQKNQELLIDSFNELDKLGYDFTLLVIGHYFDEEKTLALRSKACNKIHFFGSKNNVQDYLICSDAFCLTSFYEGLPISLLEAMSCGCVPICTPVGGIVDVIKHGVTGYLSKDVSLNNYVSTLQEYMNNNKVSGENVSEYFRKNFSIESVANKYLEVYKKE